MGVRTRGARPPSPLTQQLCDDVQGLAPEEQLPVPATVAGEALLAAGVSLLKLHEVGRHVIVLGDDGVAWVRE